MKVSSCTCWGSEYASDMPFMTCKKRLWKGAA
jgi:hypothetical protein